MCLHLHRPLQWGHLLSILRNTQAVCTSFLRSTRLHISCILYVHKHRDTSPRDDECERRQYDDECECEQYNDEVHDIRGSADLRTSLQISLTRGFRGCASALGIHTRTCGIGKYYTSNLSKTGGHPQMSQRQDLKSWLHVFAFAQAPIVGPLTKYSSKYSGRVHIIFAFHTIANSGDHQLSFSLQPTTPRAPQITYKRRSKGNEREDVTTQIFLLNLRSLLYTYHEHCMQKYSI